MHRKGSMIIGTKMPRDSKVVEVSATREVPLDCKRNSVGKGRLCAAAWRWSCSGKRILMAEEVSPAMFPLGVLGPQWGEGL